MPDARPFTVKTLADRWDCSEQTIRNMIADGLEVFRLGCAKGSSIRIRADVVEAWERSGGNTQSYMLTKAEALADICKEFGERFEIQRQYAERVRFECRKFLQARMGAKAEQ